jgi:hypothetical protein
MSLDKDQFQLTTVFLPYTPQFTACLFIVYVAVLLLLYTLFSHAARRELSSTPLIGRSLTYLYSSTHGYPDKVTASILAYNFKIEKREKTVR